MEEPLLKLDAGGEDKCTFFSDTKTQLGKRPDRIQACRFSLSHPKTDLADAAKNK